MRVITLGEPLSKSYMLHIGLTIGIYRQMSMGLMVTGFRFDKNL